MKLRLPLFVCLLAFFTFPLFAQTTLTMTNGYTQTVTAKATDVTTNSLVTSQSETPNYTWDTKFAANTGNMVQIEFDDATGHSLANTPFVVSDVANARLYYNSQWMVMCVGLTPAPGTGQGKQDIDGANEFIAMKRPTKSYCMTVKVMEHAKHKVVRLANGAILIASGKLGLLPKTGKSACLCGRGVDPEAGSKIARFDVQKLCNTATPAKKK
jgi:hypothetical protein